MGYGSRKFYKFRPKGKKAEKKQKPVKKAKLVGKYRRLREEERH